MVAFEEFPAFFRAHLSDIAHSCIYPPFRVPEHVGNHRFPDLPLVAPLVFKYMDKPYAGFLALLCLSQVVHPILVVLVVPEHPVKLKRYMALRKVYIEFLAVYCGPVVGEDGLLVERTYVFCDFLFLYR